MADRDAPRRQRHEEVSALIARLRGADRVAAVVALHSGLRPAELIELRWTDFDLDNTNDDHTGEE
jgi:integrase